MYTQQQTKPQQGDQDPKVKQNLPEHYPNYSKNTEIAMKYSLGLWSDTKAVGIGWSKAQKILCFSIGRHVIIIISVFLSSAIENHTLIFFIGHLKLKLCVSLKKTTKKQILVKENLCFKFFFQLKTVKVFFREKSSTSI